MSSTKGVMKKVLIIAHLLKASPRIPGLAKYLPEFGWQPVILTAPLAHKLNNNLSIVETPYRETLGFWKRIFKVNPNQDEKTQLKQRFGITSQRSLLDWFLTRVGEIVNYPDSDKGWRSFAIEAGDKLISEGGFEAIISSSSPVTSHVIAKKLKLKHNLPWVADLRDLWTQNHNYGYGPLRRWFDTRLEIGTLSAANALVTVSQPWAEQLGSLHKGKKVFSITNGFDPESTNVPPAALNPKFTITHTGNIYAGKQEPAKLLEAVRSLIDEKVIGPYDIEIRFFGPRLEWLDMDISRYGLFDVAKQLGHLPQQAAIEKQRESHVLLHFKWEDPSELGAYSLKILEYLGARRPILATGGYGRDVVQELLEETNAGISATDMTSIKLTLCNWFKEFQNKGKVEYAGIDSKVMNYSYRETARRWSNIIDELIDSKVVGG